MLDNPPSQGYTSVTRRQSKHSLNGLDSRKDKLESTLEVALTVLGIITLVFVMIALVGGFLYALTRFGLS